MGVGRGWPAAGRADWLRIRESDSRWPRGRDRVLPNWASNSRIGFEIAKPMKAPACEPSGREPDESIGFEFANPKGIGRAPCSRPGWFDLCRAICNFSTGVCPPLSRPMCGHTDAEDFIFRISKSSDEPRHDSLSTKTAGRTEHKKCLSAWGRQALTSPL